MLEVYANSCLHPVVESKAGRPDIRTILYSKSAPGFRISARCENNFAGVPTNLRESYTKPNRKIIIMPGQIIAGIKCFGIISETGYKARKPMPSFLKRTRVVN